MTGLGLVVGNGDSEKKKKGKKIFVSAEPSRHIPSAQGPGTLDTWEQASFLPVWRRQTGTTSRATFAVILARLHSRLHGYQHGLAITLQYYIIRGGRLSC